MFKPYKYVYKVNRLAAVPIVSSDIIYLSLDDFSCIMDK